VIWFFLNFRIHRNFVYNERKFARIRKFAEWIFLPGGEQWAQAGDWENVGTFSTAGGGLARMSLLSEQVNQSIRLHVFLDLVREGILVEFRTYIVFMKARLK
jgi:hypothetical protein